MKLFKLALILIATMSPLFSEAQNCAEQVDLHKKFIKPFQLNDMSKSAVCVSGSTYEFKIPLTKGREYRMQFYAAAVFNNKINFTIIDESTHETVLNLPGETYERKVGSCVLASWYDEDTEKEYTPYFDFYPPTSTTLKVIMEIPEAPQEKAADGGVAPKKIDKGCVTIILYDKPAEGSW